MKPILAVPMLAFALLAGTATAQDASSYPSSPDLIQPATVTDPQEFATKAGGAGLFEVQTSQLALTKSQNADIQAFAQMMIDDHTKAGEALKTAAGAQQAISVPTDMDAASAAKFAQLNDASGADFDKLYVQMQTDAHVEAVGLFSGYAANGAAGALKDFAAQTLPTLKMHYEHVLALKA